MKKKIIIISGDPNSINSEIIYKTWKKISKKIRKRIILISNYKLIQDQFKKLNYRIKLKLINNIYDKSSSEALNILNVKLNYKKPFDVPLKDASKFIFSSFNLAHSLALDKNIGGIINCPIDKKLLKNKHAGVTELLSNKCLNQKNSEVMIILNDNLIVSPITTHLRIKSISKKLSKKIIINKILSIHNWYKEFYRKKPYFGVLGLNPHNAEFKRNSEEKKIILPAIKGLKKKGIKLSGPLSPDTIFINDYKSYDVIIGMYHDQVLTPFKTLYKYDAINVTVGLKYHRASPDHGVAKNKILLKKSNPNSLIKCIKHINLFCK